MLLGFILPTTAMEEENSSTNDLSDKLIYSLFFVEKGERGYNEGLQKKFKQYGITGPLYYLIFSKDLTTLNNKAHKAYKEWQMRNPDENDYVYLDFPNTELNALRSDFDNQDGGSPFDITIMEIRKLSDTKAEVTLLCDDSEFVIADGEGGYTNALEAGYGCIQQATKRICLVKDNGQWKVDNVIREFNYDGELHKIDWKKELKSFILNPTEFMPYLGF